MREPVKPMSENEIKRMLRDEIRKRRKELSDSDHREKSRLISERLFSLPAYKNAEQIMIYLDCRKEVSTSEMILRAWSDGKRVAVPKCRGQEMDFIEITDFSGLINGTFGIREPASGDPVEWENALMIMPGVAFDRDLNRVGYGGGYYDRYLSRHLSICRAAAAFDFQVFESVPSCEHDIRPQILITDREIICEKII